MLTIYPVAIFQYTIIYHFGLTGGSGGCTTPALLIGNQIFSVKNRLFKSFIFGQTPTFQKFYFRRRRDFSFFFICLNRADLVFLTFDDGLFLYVWRRDILLYILCLRLLLCLHLLPPVPIESVFVVLSKSL